MLAGGPLHIRYAKKRLLAGPELSNVGPHSFNLTGYFVVNDGAPTAFDLGGRQSPGAGFAEATITLLENARRLAVWFQRGGLYGSPRYDADFGRNYAFDVFPVLDLSGPVRRYVAELAEQKFRS